MSGKAGEEVTAFTSEDPYFHQGKKLLLSGPHPAPFLGAVHSSLVLFTLLPVGHFKKILFQARCWWEMQQQLEMP